MRIFMMLDRSSLFGLVVKKAFLREENAGSCSKQFPLGQFAVVHRFKKPVLMRNSLGAAV